MRKTNVILILLALWAGCTKVEKIFYKNDPITVGSIVGVVVQKDSGAKVMVRQAVPIDSTYINPVDGTFRIDSLTIGNYDVVITADCYGTHTIHDVTVIGGGVTYVGEISLSKLPDMVASHYPEDGGEVVYNNRFSRLSISIRFTRPMDRKSVEEAFSTDPPSDGIFYWGKYRERTSPIYFHSYELSETSGAEITTYSKVKAFTYCMAQKDCFVDTTYTVTLSTAARDTAGNHLKFPLRFSFRTVQSSVSVNAILTDPCHGDVNVDLIRYRGIEVTFPRRMNQASVEEALSMIPDVSRILLWPADNVLSIYTGGPLLADTTYIIRIDSTAEDLDGVPMGAPFEFSFTTRPVEVERTTPRNGQLFVDHVTNITIRFDTYMSRSSVQNAFSIDPPVSGSFSYEHRRKDIIVFNPHSSLQANTKYTVTIGTEAHDLYGTHLKEPYSFSFVTSPE